MQRHLWPHRRHPTWSHTASDTRGCLLSSARHPRSDGERLRFPFGAATGRRRYDSQPITVAITSGFGWIGGSEAHNGRIDCIGMICKLIFI